MIFKVERHTAEKIANYPTYFSEYFTSMPGIHSANLSISKYVSKLYHTKYRNQNVTYNAAILMSWDREKNISAVKYFHSNCEIPRRTEDQYFSPSTGTCDRCQDRYGYYSYTSATSTWGYIRPTPTNYSMTAGTVNMTLPRNLYLENVVYLTRENL